MIHQSAEIVVEVKDLRKAYRSVSVLCGVTLEIYRGEFFGLIGPNGAGKTTLVETIEGLRTPDAGVAMVLGSRTHPRNVSVLNRIGVQVQSSAFLHKHTVDEHVSTIASLYGRSRGDAEFALESMSLGELANRRIDKLSGGQKQRLAIATAMVHQPEILILDEPTAGLDPQSRRELWAALRSLRRNGSTIIYTTHFLDEAEELCDRVGILDGGRIVSAGSPAGLIQKYAPEGSLFTDRRDIDLIALGGLSEVLAVSEDERGRLELLVLDPVRALTQIENAGISTAGFKVKNGSLEDVYVKVTGKEFADEQL